VVEQTERDDAGSRRSFASVGFLPVLLIDLGLTDIFENIAEALYEGAFDIIERMFGDTIGQMLQIPPSRLGLMQDMWSISIAVYFSLLGILGLSYLGMFQLFPDSKKTDPYRFMGRAFAATLSLLIVNPPGTGNAFSRGAFAWALQITNTLISYFLVDMSYSPDNYGATEGLVGALGFFGAMSFGLLMLLVVGILLLIMYVVLAARELVILVTYGLYPLLIVFWVADMGPMKYGKQLAGKLFKATGMLIPLGILLAAILSAAGQMMSGALVGAGGGNPVTRAVMGTLPIPVAAFMIITMTIGPLKMAGVGLGAAAGQAKGAASKAGRKGKSMVRGGAASGGAAGMAGGGLLGASLADRDGSDTQLTARQTGTGFVGDDSGTQVQQDAPELQSPSAVGGQTSLGQYRDGEAPDRAAFKDPGGVEAYTEATQESGADAGTAPDTTDTGTDTSDSPDVTLDPDSQSAEEFRDSWAKASDAKQAEFMHENLQSDHPARKLVKEMAGPASGAVVGGAVALTGIGGMGLAGAVLAGGATAAGAGTVAFALKETTDKGLRGGWDQVKTAGIDSYQTLGTKVSNTYNKYTKTAPDTSAGDSGGKDDGIF